MRHAIFSIFLSILAVSPVFAADGGSWFDMQNCEMCKPLIMSEGLMKHMTWEHHNVSSGLVSISKVDQDYLDSYIKAQMQMNAVAEKWMRGEPVYLCNMCKDMGSILKSGAVSDMVESGDTFIRVTSSANPEILEAIHKWTDRTNKEMQAMMQSQHSGHKH
jgi:hypothetical protein